MRSTLLLLAVGGLALALAPPEDRGRVGLDELDWMVGSWSGQAAGLQQEEVWLPAKAGIMLGVHRDVDPSRRLRKFEFLRIEQEGATIELVTLPNARAESRFRLVGSDNREATFENRGGGFPARITYRAEGDELVAVLDGGARSVEARWTRAW